MIIKNKGFTLIEILIALAILGIISLAISSFFFSNYRALKNTSDELDIQREGERIITFITLKAIESKGIVEPSNLSMNYTLSSNGSRIVFGIKNEDTANEEEKGYIFVITEHNTGEGKEPIKQLRYLGEGIKKEGLYQGNSENIISEGFDSIEIRSTDIVNNNTTVLNNSSSIEIVARFSKGKEFISQINFRNK